MTTATRTADSAVKGSRWAVLTDGPPLRKPVFYSAVIGVLVMATWAIFAPVQAESVIGEAVTWVVNWFGWFYVLLTTAVLAFVLYLAISGYGSIKLGPDHSKPQFSTFAWASMLFAAGIGTDVMFYAVAEPVSQYMAPPTGDPETTAAAREATVWTLFHYGLSGWGLYALMGMALGYFTYRLNLPLAVRSALYPIFGRRVDGSLGHACRSVSARRSASSSSPSRWRQFRPRRASTRASASCPSSTSFWRSASPPTFC
jgi:choline/glycine/proline betaine transport protein